MEENKSLFIEKVFNNTIYTDKELYRVRVTKKSRFAWKILYKYSDLFIACSEDIIGTVSDKLVEFYNIIEEEIKINPAFERSLAPLLRVSSRNKIVLEMNDVAKTFNVGPMAAVAGSLCDFIGRDIKPSVKYLVIENGGDAYLRSQNDIIASVFLKNRYFKKELKIRIKKNLFPCGMASSSGTFGHSFSLGKSDIALVVAKNATMADAAATAFANMIKKKSELEKAIDFIKDKKDIYGLLAIKDEKLAAYGKIELV